MTPTPMPDALQERGLARPIALAAELEGGDHRHAVGGHEGEGAEHVEEDDPLVHRPILGWLSSRHRCRRAIGRSGSRIMLELRRRAWRLQSRGTEQ